MVRPSRLNLLCSGLATTRTLCHCSQTSKATTCCDRWKRIRVQPSSSRSLASSSGPSVATKQHKVLKYKTAASHASLLKIHYYSELISDKKVTNQAATLHAFGGIAEPGVTTEGPAAAEDAAGTGGEGEGAGVEDEGAGVEDEGAGGEDFARYTSCCHRRFFDRLELGSSDEQLLNCHY